MVPASLVRVASCLRQPGHGGDGAGAAGAAVPQCRRGSPLERQALVPGLGRWLRLRSLPLFARCAAGWARCPGIGAETGGARTGLAPVAAGNPEGGRIGGTHRSVARRGLSLGRLAARRCLPPAGGLAGVLAAFHRRRVGRCAANAAGGRRRPGAGRDAHVGRVAGALAGLVGQALSALSLRLPRGVVALHHRAVRRRQSRGPRKRRGAGLGQSGREPGRGALVPGRRAVPAGGGLELRAGRVAGAPRLGFHSRDGRQGLDRRPQRRAGAPIGCGVRAGGAAAGPRCLAGRALGGGWFAARLGGARAAALAVPGQLGGTGPAALGGLTGGGLPGHAPGHRATA